MNQRSLKVPRFLISFNYGEMTVSDAELPEVGEAAHAVVRDAKAAGVLVFAGGVLDPRETRVVARDGTATDGPHPARTQLIGGITIVEVASRAEALAWAARIAAACRCAQEVREFMDGSLTLND
jgi:hypothetical protein